MMQKLSIFSFLIIVLYSVVSCTNNKFQVNVNEHIETKVYRFDQELMQIDTSNINNEIDNLYSKYPLFFPAYTYGVIGIGGRELRDFSTNLIRFVSNNISQEVYQEVQKKYNDISDVKKDLDKALSYYHYYFPNEVIPEIYFMQSGFNQRIIVDSSFIGIALDMCLGKDSKYYNQLALPAYIKLKMNKESISIDALRGQAWASFAFDGEDNLASNIIYEGKIQYFLDAMFPDKTDAQKLSYSENDIKWVNAHEEDIWAVILQDEMLYQTDQMKIKNMIGNAPFTQAFGNNSPAKIGVWLGWRIVKAYMNEHPEVTLQELMNNKDYISILNESNYKP